MMLRRSRTTPRAEPWRRWKLASWSRARYANIESTTTQNRSIRDSRIHPLYLGRHYAPLALTLTLLPLCPPASRLASCSGTAPLLPPPQGRRWRHLGAPSVRHPLLAVFVGSGHTPAPQSWRVVCRRRPWYHRKNNNVFVSAVLPLVSASAAVLGTLGTKRYTTSDTRQQPATIGQQRQHLDYSRQTCMTSDY